MHAPVRGIEKERTFPGPGRAGQSHEARGGAHQGKCRAMHEDAFRKTAGSLRERARMLHRRPNLEQVGRRRRGMREKGQLHC